MARIHWRNDGSVDITFRYHPDLVEDLKLGIPSWQRSYDPTTKTWTVESEYANDASDILLGYYPNAEVVRGNVSAGREGDYATLYLLPTAPPSVVVATYRALAKLNHPDLLPEGERERATRHMQAINDAYGRLSK